MARRKRTEGPVSARAFSDGKEEPPGRTFSWCLVRSLDAPPAPEMHMVGTGAGGPGTDLL